MTDAVSETDVEPAPELLATHFLASVDEMIEHLRAADLLGLGVRVRSYLESDEETGGFSARWELELLTSSPVLQDEETG